MRTVAVKGVVPIEQIVEETTGKIPGQARWDDGRMSQLPETDQDGELQRRRGHPDQEKDGKLAAQRHFGLVVQKRFQGKTRG
jgi:hypothetical protein